MTSTTTTTTRTVDVPYMLEFAPGGRPGLPNYRPGRGTAGYTVARVALEELPAFLAALPREAWMPGTYRCLALTACACGGHLTHQVGTVAEGPVARKLAGFVTCDRCEYAAEVSEI